MVQLVLSLIILIYANIASGDNNTYCSQFTTCPSCNSMHFDNNNEPIHCVFCKTNTCVLLDSFWPSPCPNNDAPLTQCPCDTLNNCEDCSSIGSGCAWCGSKDMTGTCMGANSTSCASKDWYTAQDLCPGTEKALKSLGTFLLLIIVGVSVCCCAIVISLIVLCICVCRKQRDRYQPIQ